MKKKVARPTMMERPMTPQTMLHVTTPVEILFDDGDEMLDGLPAGGPELDEMAGGEDEDSVTGVPAVLVDIIELWAGVVDSGPSKIYVLKCTARVYMKSNDSLKASSAARRLNLPFYDENAVSIFCIDVATCKLIHH